MMLIENVVVQYGDISLEADSVLFDKLKQSITAYGIKKATFKDEAIAKDAYKNVIRYTKGEGRFYTE